MKCPTVVLLISLFFVAPALCFAQDDNENLDYEYEPLVQDGAWWLRYWSCGDILSSVSWYVLSYFEGDSVINGQAYNVFYNYDIDQFNYEIEFFREEDKKVFQYNTYYDTEILIFDFNKTINEVIEYDYPWSENNNNCIIVDTILVNNCNSNSNFFKEYVLNAVNSSSYCPNVYFERLGAIYSENHPFAHKNSATCFVELTLFGLFNEILFKQDCDEEDFLPPFNSMQELEAHFDSTYVSNIPVITSKISVYPNPVVDVVNIDSDLPINLIEIYSIEGKRVAEFSNERVLDIGHLAKGIYIVSVELEGGELFKQKIVRQ